MLTLDKNSDFKRIETSKIQSKYYDLDVIEAWVPIKIIRNKTQLQRDKENHAISFYIYYNSNDGMIRDHCFARRLRK